MKTIEIISENLNRVESLEMLAKHHLGMINQLNSIIDNQRMQIDCLQKTADSSVLTINKMSRIIGDQVTRINELKLKASRLKQGQFIQNEN